MWCILSRIIYEFPVIEAQLHQTKLCAALKSKRIKRWHKLGWTWCVFNFWFEFSRRLYSKRTNGSCFPKHMAATHAIYIPYGVSFRQPSDYKMSGEIALGPHYRLQTVSIPLCSTAHSSRRDAFHVIAVCAASVPEKLGRTATPLPPYCEKCRGFLQMPTA